MIPWLRVCLRVAVVAHFVGARAHAAEAPRLDYVVAEGAASCPSEPEFREAVAARLGRDPFAAGSSRHLLVDVRLEAGVLAATGALVEADGRSAGLRRITGAPGDCREVVEGMALAVSLALGLALPEPDEREVSPPTTEPNPPPLKPPPPTPSPKPEAKPVAAPAQPVDETEPAPTAGEADADRFDFGGGVVGHAALGVGPGIGAGASVFVMGRRGPWSLSVEGRLDGLSSGMTFDGGGSATTTLLAGAVAPCRHFGPVLTCAVGLAGRVGAESKDVSTPGDDSAPYAAAGGRLGVEWPLSSALLVQGRLDVLVTLLPVDIELGETAVWSSPPVSGLLGAGLVGLLP